MDKSEHFQDSPLAALPPVLDLRQQAKHFGLKKTVAYALAGKGEITSLTIGAPGKRGKRMFLTDSILKFIERRVATSPPLHRRHSHCTVRENR